ncbi:MAG: DUF1073 domain-containing protein, partial [Pseudomonadota bacterium]|nr:DUF1073 domain-containing protein [Pseudomonadota bacterium]
MLDIRKWFGGHKQVDPSPAQPSPIAEPSPQWTVRGLEEALGYLSAARKEEPRQHALRLPKPYPGVVPDAKPTMAADAQINAVYNFGASYGYSWDGYGFMGYALLSDLAQLPEYRRPSEILANEMTRKWIKLISTSADDKTEKLKDIKAELERLHTQETFRRAFEIDNFFGISQIYIDLGTEGDELKSPLILKAKVGKNKLKGLRLIEPLWIYPNAYNSINPLKADYYKPQTWYVLGTEIHESRLMTFVSRPVPDMLKPAYLFGGISLSQLMKPYVDNWIRTRQSVSDITHNFSTPVLKVDMGQTMAPGAAQQLALRGQVFNMARDNQGLMILDMVKEDFVNVSAPLGSLDALQAQAQEQMASIASIPLVKLLGITPSGL